LANIQTTFRNIHPYGIIKLTEVTASFRAFLAVEHCARFWWFDRTFTCHYCCVGSVITYSPLNKFFYIFFILIVTCFASMPSLCRVGDSVLW